MDWTSAFKSFSTSTLSCTRSTGICGSGFPLVIKILVPPKSPEYLFLSTLSPMSPPVKATMPPYLRACCAVNSRVRHAPWENPIKYNCSEEIPFPSNQGPKHPTIPTPNPATVDFEFLGPETNMDTRYSWLPEVPDGQNPEFQEHRLIAIYSGRSTPGRAT